MNRCLCNCFAAGVVCTCLVQGVKAPPSSALMSVFKVSIAAASTSTATMIYGPVNMITGKIYEPTPTAQRDKRFWTIKG